MTPVLENLGIEVPRPTPEEKCQFIDKKYLGNYGILLSNFLVYIFLDRTSIYQYIQLPQVGYTTLINKENLEFLTLAEVLYERLVQGSQGGSHRIQRAPLPLGANPEPYDVDGQCTTPRVSTSSQHWTSTSSFLQPDFSAYMPTELSHEPQSETER